MPCTFIATVGSNPCHSWIHLGAKPSLARSASAQLGIGLNRWRQTSLQLHSLLQFCDEIHSSCAAPQSGGFPESTTTVTNK